MRLYLLFLWEEKLINIKAIQIFTQLSLIGKILIFSFVLYLIFWIIFRNNFVDKSFDETSWLPIVFYLIIYTFSYLEAQSHKGQKTFLQRVKDNEQVTYNERPNLYNQFLGNCLAIQLIAIYDIYLIFTV